MKLPEVLDVLLKAEDEAREMRDEAELEAKAIIQKAHEKFLSEQETRLSAAREEASAQVEHARQSSEMETRQVAELSQKAMARMREHFDNRAPALVTKITEESALRYASRGSQQERLSGRGLS